MPTEYENVSGLTSEYVRGILLYFPLTGELKWQKRVSDKCAAGTPAGALKGSGYIHIGILGSRFAAHRIIWLYMTGRWPRDQIDHIDRNKSNNIWSNLREATKRQNGMNTPPRLGLDGKKRSLPAGITKHRKKFIAWHNDNGRTRYIGIFDNPEDALKARLEVISPIYGDQFVH